MLLPGPYFARIRRCCAAFALLWLESWLQIHALAAYIGLLLPAGGATVTAQIRKFP